MSDSRLPVALLRQAKDSNFCGICCLQMLYHYHGISQSAAELAAGLQLIPNGVYAQELGRHLCRSGFAATLITRDTTRFPVSDAELSGEALLARFVERLDAAPDGHRERMFWHSMLGFLKAGGRLRLEIPTLDGTIGRALGAGNPVIVCLDAKALYDLAGRSDGPVDPVSVGQAGHYVVVVGLDSSTVTVADPSATFGGISRHPRERFLYAWYSFQAYSLIAERARDSL